MDKTVKKNKIKKQIKQIEIELRKELSALSLKKCAELTGLKYQDIQAWLSGKRKWSIEKILRISEVLDEHRNE